MSGEGETAPQAKPDWYPDESQADTIRYWGPVPAAWILGTVGE